MGTILMIIAQNGFQDIEYQDSRKALEKAGHKITVAAPALKKAIGKYDAIVHPDIALSDVSIDSYDAVVVIGGPGALSLGDSMEFFKVLKLASDAHKVIGAICIAPRLLAQAGLLTGKHATVWNGDGIQSVFLEQQGAQYSDLPTVVDGNIVTGNGPDAATAFGEHVAHVLERLKGGRCYDAGQ